MLVTNMYTQLNAFAITKNDCVSSCEVVLEDFTVKEVLQGSCHNFNTSFQSSKEKGRESQWNLTGCAASDPDVTWIPNAAVPSGNQPLTEEQLALLLPHQDCKITWMTTSVSLLIWETDLAVLIDWLFINLIANYQWHWWLSISNCWTYSSFFFCKGSSQIN